jgi:hypothetical protein
MRRLLNAGTVFLLAAISLSAVAQQPMPRLLVPPVADPSGASLSQASAYTVFQQCRIENKATYDLFSAAQNLISIRDHPQSVEITFRMNPNLRNQYPGGVEQMLSMAFETYRKLGGTARTVAEVSEGTNPCPPPTPYPAHQQREAVPIRGSSSMSVR